MKEKEKKIPLEPQVHAELEKKAEAEGTTPDKLAEKIIVEKATESSSTAEKPKVKRGRKQKTKEPTQTAEPNNGKKPFINPYGFIHLSKNVQEKFGVTAGKKTPITIEVQGDTLLVKKA